MKELSMRGMLKGFGATVLFAGIVSLSAVGCDVGEDEDDNVGTVQQAFKMIVQPGEGPYQIAQRACPSNQTDYLNRVANWIRNNNANLGAGQEVEVNCAV
ncbi:hypothetical protein WME94_30200 [Sorangium sp. So ce429]